ncbi:MAG: ShlB/FhaC/HecB family hemolysin secretion/activation protein [Gammaproteobacteria bacterium]|nr:ShlB/FhaC/HecB family hemolysin secretion/activation protein [Gammaproteobacteria bacterium]
MGKHQKINGLAVLIALTPLVAVAAPAANPDGGLLIQIFNAPSLPKPEKKAPDLDVQQEARPAFKAPEGFKVKVKSFRITNASAYPEATLLPLLSGFVGQDLSMVDLDEAAARISKYYRMHGYFVARAYMPAQEIKDGVVEISILEGKIDGVDVKVNGNSTRLSQNVAKTTVESSAKIGAVVQDKTLERGLLLLNDLPGVDVKSTLVPGATSGTSRLMVEAHEGTLVTGSLDADNFGNKFTGDFRAGATVNINDPSGRGDLISLRGMTAGSGLNYGRVSYMSPVGSDGLKLGAAYSQMTYKLGDAYTPLNAKGDAKVASLYALYPFVRTRDYSLYGNAGLDVKALTDKSLGFVTNDKKINVLSAGVNGNGRDNYLSGGLSAFAGTLSAGNLSGVLSEDQLLPAFALSRGSYAKLNYSASTLRRVNDQTSLFLSVVGQYASKNLDSSEKLILGGSSGIRAYPQGEAAGDIGTIVNLEARYNFPERYASGDVQLVGFIDAGQITLHSKMWTTTISTPTTPYLRNTYMLSGAGFGVNFTKQDDYMIYLTSAWKVGSNPAADASGADSSGSTSRIRVWLQGIKWF